MFTKEDYEARIKELKELKSAVVLDADPTAKGLKTFNEKLAFIQSSRERIAELVLEAIWNKNEAQVTHDTVEAIYEKKVSQTVSSNPDVMSLKSADLRKAKTDDLLNVELSTVQQASIDLLYADSFYKSVQVIDKLYDVKNNNLLQQIFTVRMMTNIDPALRDELKIQMRTQADE